MNAHLIVPCYNESSTLLKSFPIINTLLSETSKELHGVLFVNDGSSDETQQVLEKQKKMLPPILRVQNNILQLQKNKGKAAAVLAGMEKLKQEGKIRDNDIVFLLDGDIVETIPSHIIQDIKEMFLSDPQLNMVIIWANEWYASDEVMIEASGQRVVKFWPAYKALSFALAQDDSLWYGIEWFFNTVFEDSTKIYKDLVIVSKPPYRSNNKANSAITQATDLQKWIHLAQVTKTT